jgi:dipeptidyl aminopeptidase/acylaminoacyl peptidase
VQPIQASDYHDLATVSDPRHSPDGERVVFVRHTPEDDESVASTVCVVSVGASENVRQFTATAGVDSEPRWSPSGDRLAFTATRGDDDRTQLWVMPTDGGEARQVTDVPGAVSEIAWSRDGERIAFVQSVMANERDAGHDYGDTREEGRETPDPRVLDRLVYRAGEQYFDGTRSHVYTTDLDGDIERVTDGEYDYGPPTWSAEFLYFTAKRTDDPDDNTVVDVLAHDPSTGETEELFQTNEWLASIAATSDDRVAYTHTPPEMGAMGQTDLKVYDRSVDESATLTADLDRTVDPMSFDWDHEEESVVFITPDEGEFVVRRAQEDEDRGIETAVAEGHVTGMSAAGERVAFVKSAWDHPGDVFVRENGETTRLTRVNEDYLANHVISEPEAIRFSDDDGPEIDGWVLTPPAGVDVDGGGSRNDGPYPLVTEIHGGPHAMWSTAGTMWHEFQTLAARGYAVFWSNPRGSTGYGQEFQGAIGHGE